MLLGGSPPVQPVTGAANQTTQQKESAISNANTQNNGVIDKNTGLESNKMVHQTQNNPNSNKVKNNRERATICKTCQMRAYQDGSNDPGVSMKSPTKISPENAASAVMSHEQEHVTREQAKAKSEDRQVVSQSVVLHNAICPECGKTYVSGGTTTTVTASKQEKNIFDNGANRFNNSLDIKI